MCWRLLETFSSSLESSQGGGTSLSLACWQEVGWFTWKSGVLRAGAAGTASPEGQHAQAAPTLPSRQAGGTGEN